MYRWALLVLGLCLPAFAPAEEWDPITEDQLAVTKPRVDPDADAEAIFWKVWVNLELGAFKIEKEQYLRIKIFTQRGVEQQSTVDLVSSIGDLRVDDLRARTIKPNGHIIELDESHVFERTAVRARGLRLKVKAFSMPGVQPGDIVEYRWKQSHHIPFRVYSNLYLEREIPSWSVTFHFKPTTSSMIFLDGLMKTQAFNMPLRIFEQGPDGFYSSTWRRVEAFKAEPRMPPEDNVRRWMLFFYAREFTLDPDQYWIEYGKKIYDLAKSLMKVDRAIKKKASELTAGISAAEEKVDRIRKFCLDNIKNIYHDRTGMAADRRRDIKENKKPSHTLKRGTGSGFDISMLFAALVNAAGLEARLAECAGRDDSFFNPQFLDGYFLDRAHVAVRVGEDWKFYDLSNPYLEKGMLDWPEEGVLSLISDPEHPVFVRTPYSGPVRNRVVRKGTLKLLPDGSVEGSLRETYRGHLGVSKKMEHDGQTDDERKAAFEAALQARFDSVAISNVRFENVTDTKEPFTVHYDIRVGNYAERTGKRLFLPPAFFQRNLSPVFLTSERKYDVYFHYSWSEFDDLSFEIPEGFELESVQPPTSYQGANVYSYRVNLVAAPESKVRYRRHFRFGENGNILFPVSSYPDLKRIFDLIKNMDNHMVAFRDRSVSGPDVRGSHE